MFDEQIFHLSFSYFEGIGPLRFKLLTKFFGSAKKAFTSSEKDLFETGLPYPILKKFLIFRKSFSHLKIQSELKNKEINYIALCDKLYPQLLKEIEDPPIGIFYKGEIERILKDFIPVAVVGTRKMSGYGREACEKIVKGLSENGITVVSGMAYGIDTVAHNAAISNGGKTVAVLGCGVDIIHPVSNSELYKNIIEKSGVVISEYPPGTRVDRRFFPARNRIISGLSLGTVVVEGALNSGSLITARFAAEQGRDVFAVPGPITSYLTQGPLKLIKDGAKAVSDSDDILTELNITKVNKFRKKSLVNNQLNDKEILIIEILKQENLNFDELVRKSRLNSSEIAQILSILEIKGLVYKKGSVYYLQI